MYHIIWILLLQCSFSQFGKSVDDRKIYSPSGKKFVFMRSTSHVGYVKSIQQSASAVAEYPHAFDSTLQSKRLHFTVHTYSSHKKIQPYLFTLDLTIPHLGDCCLWHKSLNSLLLCTDHPYILKCLLFLFSLNTRDNFIKSHIGAYLALQ